MKQAQILVVIQFILFGILLVTFVAFPTVPNTAARVVGAVLVVICFSVFMLAISAHQATNRALPRISPEPDEQATLVERGIYAHIRHPFYTSVITGAVGSALLHGSAASLIVAGIIVVFFTYKSIFEEGLLRRTYPDYEDYRQRTGRFMPPLLKRSS